MYNGKKLKIVSLKPNILYKGSTSIQINNLRFAFEVYSFKKLDAKIQYISWHALAT